MAKFINGEFKVEWEWIGEGKSGDYNPTDKDDVPYLRFYCFKRFGKQWEEIWQTSCCTHVRRGTSHKVLEGLTSGIFKALEDNAILDLGGDTPEFEASKQLQRALEKLSWMEA